MSRNHFDDSRDDALAEALRAAVPPPPVRDVDWHALHARIAASAEPHFGAVTDSAQPSIRPQERAASWWQPLAGWSPRGIPLAAAATVLLMIGAGVIGTAPQQAVPAGDAVSFHTLEEELVFGLATGVRPLLAGVETEGMLDAALFYDGEDW